MGVCLCVCVYVFVCGFNFSLSLSVYCLDVKEWLPHPDAIIDVRSFGTAEELGAYVKARNGYTTRLGVYYSASSFHQFLQD